MKKITIFILNILMFSSLLSQSKYSDVKVVETTSSYIILEFTPVYDSLKKVSSTLEDFSVLKFKDNIFGSQIPGYPDIASRNITLGLPALEGNVVEVTGSAYETINNINYQPAATYSRSKDSIGQGSSYIKNEKAYRTNSFYPENIVELVNVGIARDKILGSLKINPLQYNPVTKQLKKYSKIRVKINFGYNKTVSSNTTNSLGGKDNLI